MPETPPTTTEMQLAALAAAYGLPPEELLRVALHNLTVITGYQMGREGASAERVFALLLAPALRAEAEAPAFPEPDQARPQHREVLRAAREMREPFTSREVAARIGGHSGSVGQVLASSGWPSEPPQVGRERRWLPRQAG